LQLYESHREDIDLVLLDVRMPGLDGPQTLQELRGSAWTFRSCS